MGGPTLCSEMGKPRPRPGEDWDPAPVNLSISLLAPSLV